MRPLLALVAAAWLGLGSCLPRDPQPGPLRVMTYNVLCSFCGGSDFDPFSDRIGYVADVIRRHDPDLLGLQELFDPTEVSTVLALAHGYTPIYYRAPPFLDYADAAIFYRTERFELVERGFYWLSPTPEEPGSIGFAERLQIPRLVAWAHLRERVNSSDLLFVTTHFDNNAPSQDRSAPLLLERTAPWAERMPVIVTGDFNSDLRDTAYATLVGGAGAARFQNAYNLAAAPEVESNETPVPAYDAERRIDHIFVAGAGVEWTCRRWQVDLSVYGPNRRRPSDHSAMVAELSRRTAR